MVDFSARALPAYAECQSKLFMIENQNLYEFLKDYKLLIQKRVCHGKLVLNMYKFDSSIPKIFFPYI